MYNRSTQIEYNNAKEGWSAIEALEPQGHHCRKIMMPPQSLPLQMAERLLRARPNFHKRI